VYGERETKQVSILECPLEKALGPLTEHRPGGELLVEEPKRMEMEKIFPGRCALLQFLLSSVW